MCEIHAVVEFVVFYVFLNFVLNDFMVFVTIQSSR